MDNDKILVELRKISNSLEILSIEPTKKLLANLEKKKILPSKQRINIFLLINGERTTTEIAEKVGIGQRGIQHFMKSLEEEDIIRLERKGKVFIPIKNYEKIIELI